MAVTHKGEMTFTNGEAAAMKPYRRVKLDPSSLGAVIYADAADGDGWIGVTLPMEGGDAAVGGRQTVALRTQAATFKMEASAEVVQAVALYPENDGKVSDDAGTVVIGTAMSGGAGEGSVVEVLPI